MLCGDDSFCTCGNILENFLNSLFYVTFTIISGGISSLNIYKLFNVYHKHLNRRRRCVPVPRQMHLSKRTLIFLVVSVYSGINLCPIQCKRRECWKMNACAIIIFTVTFITNIFLSDLNTCVERLLRFMQKKKRKKS